jgi:zinc transport system substrate-binding protein
MKYFLLSIFFPVIIFSGCNRPAISNYIAVTIEPQRYFAEKIAGDKFHIHTVVPPGQDPETYDATPRQMLDFNRCIAYLQIGNLGFEQTWIKKILENNPDMKSFDLSAGFNLVEEEDEHNSHSGADPHIWSSIEGARVLAKNTLEAIVSLDDNMENVELYRHNFDALMAEIDETEAEIRAMLAPLNGKSFIIYHPALTYFARENNLHQLCVELDGKEPTPLLMKSLTDAVRANDVNVIFVQPEYDRKNVRLLSDATSCRLVDINLMSYDWKREMINVAKALAQ